MFRFCLGVSSSLIGSCQIGSKCGSDHSGTDEKKSPKGFGNFETVDLINLGLCILLSSGFWSLSTSLPKTTQNVSGTHRLGPRCESVS